MWQSVDTPADGNCMYHALSEALRRAHTGIEPCDAQLLRRLTFSMYTLPLRAGHRAGVPDDERLLWLATDWPEAAEGSVAAARCFEQLDALVAPLLRSSSLGPEPEPKAVLKHAWRLPALHSFYFPLMDVCLAKRKWGDEVQMSILERVFGVRCLVLENGRLLRDTGAAPPPHGYVLLHRVRAAHYTLLLRCETDPFASPPTTALLSHTQFAQFRALRAIVLDGAVVPLFVAGGSGDAMPSAAVPSPPTLLRHALQCLRISRLLTEHCRRAPVRAAPAHAVIFLSAAHAGLWRCACSEQLLHVTDRCAYCLKLSPCKSSHRLKGP